MGKSIREVEQFDAEEIEEWALFFEEEPLPDHWLIGAMIATETHNGSMNVRKPCKLDRFLPRKRPKKMNIEAARAALGG